MAIKKVQEGKWFFTSPVIIIHPMEMIDGGLSQIEERALMELASGAGARKVVVWVGHELSDQEVINFAKTYNKLFNLTIKASLCSALSENYLQRYTRIYK